MTFPFDACRLALYAENGVEGGELLFQLLITHDEPAAAALVPA